MNCRYCGKAIAPSEQAPTNAYWSATPDVCHKTCKNAGVRAEALECQLIDADCNDCKHFKRGKLVPLFREMTRNREGKMVEITFQSNIINGHCLKFDKPAQAFPNKWTGRECFEHRRQ